MHTKTNRIIFFVVLICVAAALALAVGDRRDETRTTYSDFVQQVQTGEVSRATISVAEYGATPVTYILKDGARMQTIVPRDYQDTVAAMQAKMVNVEIHGLASQRRLMLENASPFLLLLGFWFFMMRQMKNKPGLMG